MGGRITERMEVSEVGVETGADASRIYYAELVPIIGSPCIKDPLDPDAQSAQAAPIQNASI